MFQRSQRVNELLRKEIGEIFLREIDFPEGVLATITRVETSSNLIQAKVYISVLPENQNQKVLETLNKLIFTVQQKLNRNLRMRPVPRIIFCLEDRIKEADRVEELLEGLKKEEK